MSNIQYSKFLQIEASEIYCVGDTHANWENLITYFDSKKIFGALVIFCGDNGLGFMSLEEHIDLFLTLNEECKKRNNICVLLRGNHDDASFYSGDIMNLSNFKAVPDYTILHALNHYVLCVGGAISIDRSLRIYSDEKNGEHTYWESGKPVYDEEALDRMVGSGIPIDIVCTHSCPSFCEPIDKKGAEFWYRFDKQLEDDLAEERRIMDRLYDKLRKSGMPIRKWFYGHFHFQHVEEFDGIQFILLDKYRDMDGGVYGMSMV